MQYNQRNYEGAIDSFEQCVSYGGEDIECYYLRGLAHYLLGECEQGWDILNDALPRARDIPDNENLVRNIRIGLDNITRDCPDFLGRTLPTPIPPTPIPPTPIGGFGN